jgi:hemerythrin superfamily protein
MMKERNGGRNAAILLGGVAAGILGSRLLPPLIAAMNGSSRVRAGGDPFEPLIEDHRKISSFLDQMVTAPTNSKVQRSRLLLMLKRKLAKHAMAEEDVVYPILHNQAAGADESKHLYDEHADMKILLFELESRVMSGEDWSEPVRSLRELIRGHVREEEEQVFPMLRERLGASRLPQVSGQICREEALVL